LIGQFGDDKEIRYDYDENGNMTHEYEYIEERLTNDLRSFEWNTDNCLTKARNDMMGDEVYYTYDAPGRRSLINPFRKIFNS